ncbi:glycosyltransferase family 4 protein [Desulfobacterota bacterium M19]
MKLLLTTPALNDQGGVASYINSVMPFLGNRHDIHRFEIGRTRSKSGILHPVVDQIGFHRLISSKQFDICQVNPSLNAKSFIRDGLFVWQVRRKGLPVLVFFHGWRKDFEQKVAGTYLPFFRNTFGRADAFIVLANEFKEVLRQWGVRQPIFLGTTTVEECLLDGFSIEDKIRRVRQAEKIKILFLSRLERRKGVFETVDAVSDLSAWGYPVILSIAGDGSVMAELRQYICTKKLPENTIRLLGYVKGSEKKAAFADNHIYCFPTRYGEGLPTSVVEAMAFGMPVVTCPVGGIADFFKDGAMGYLWKRNEPESLAELLKNLIDARGKITEFGRRNHVYAKENFMASRVAESLVSIYNRILYNHSADKI